MKWSFTISLVVLFQLLPFTKCTVNYHDTPPGYVLKADNGSRVRGIQDLESKDIVLGGWFIVHCSSGVGGQCSSISILTGTERIEAMLYAIDLINSDPYLLPNISIGYDIRDTCISENIGLDDESIEFVFSKDQCHGICLLNTTTLSSIITAGIGATVSRVSNVIVSLFQLFNLPQVNFSSM